MKGDFIGFSFDGVHCSELGITRVSDGDRYNENLFPEISDRTSEIIGEDGENYFGSEYRQNSFSINIAFDSITETQFRRIRRLFGTKKICELIFDERPYKVYSVKLESPIELNYICFDEEGYTWEKLPIEGTDKYYKGVTGEDYEYKKPTGKRQRIYKGEGTIELVAYYPFAKQLYKVLDLYRPENKDIYYLITTYDNVDEWAESSGILTLEKFNEYKIDKANEIDNISGYNIKIPVYNPGDLNTGFYLYIPFTTSIKSCNDSVTVLPAVTEQEYYLSHRLAPDTTPTITADASITYRVDEEDSNKYYLTNSDTENSATITFEYRYVTSPMIAPNSGDYVKIFGDNNGLLLRPILPKTNEDTGIIVNTVNHLIEGVHFDPITELNNYRNKSWTITHNIYNECIVAGDFPKILPSDWYFDNEEYKQAIYLNCDIGDKRLIQINYDYLYF